MGHRDIFQAACQLGHVEEGPSGAGELLSTAAAALRRRRRRQPAAAAAAAAGSCKHLEPAAVAGALQEAHPVPSLEQLWEYEPVLPPDALRRGGASQSGNEHLTAFVNKLLTGQAGSVVTLGGRVTFGGGASDLSLAYPHHLFRWINSTFPPTPGQPAHRFKNNGLPGTSSALFAICTQDLVPADADLVVLEFAINDEWRSPTSGGITGEGAQAFEQLLRKLRSMPRRPAVVLLAYFLVLQPRFQEEGWGPRPILHERRDQPVGLCPGAACLLHNEQPPRCMRAA